MKYTKQIYDLRNAIAEDNAEKVTEIMGCPAEKAEMLWTAIKMAMGNTQFVRSRVIRTDDSIFRPKWLHTPTRTIRVPVALADDILRFAHDLDLDTDVYSELEVILAKHRAKVKGYTANNASELIADIKALSPFSTE